MCNYQCGRSRLRLTLFKLTLAFALLLGLSLVASAQGPGIEKGNWTYLGGDAWHTRYTSANEIDASNFGELELAWEFNAASFGPSTSRATPTYVDGKLITVTGERRHVIALDPATGELLWSFTEPNTFRYEYSMRKGYGKGIAYAEIDGRGVVFITTPGFFLHALDVETGRPLENWGQPVDVAGFGKSGTVDLVKDLIDGWGPWEAWNKPYDAYQGIPLELGYITSSSPPIVVNDVVVVGNSAEQGYNQTRRENVPGDILAYDARNGDLKWKFNVIPRPGEFGHDTWENDAWKWTGDISSWAPMAADPELGLVYIPTNGPTIDYYGGFHPGDNLYGTSLIALDVETGERKWHYQMVRHDIWNYDTPTAPLLMDVTVDGKKDQRHLPSHQASVGLRARPRDGRADLADRGPPRPAVDGSRRETGRDPAVPDETRTFRSPRTLRGAPHRLHARAAATGVRDGEGERVLRALCSIRRSSRIDPNASGPGAGLACPGGGGGANIYSPSVADPVSGVMFVASASGCSAYKLMPGAESPLDTSTVQTGVTHSDWSRAAGAGGRRGGRGGGGRPDRANIDGLSIWKGPVSRITAIDMNTGEHLWVVPNGDADEEDQEDLRNHPLLQGVENAPTNPGRRGVAVMVATPNLLMASGPNRAMARGASSPSTRRRASAWERSRFPVPPATGCRAGSTTANST